MCNKTLFNLITKVKPNSCQTTHSYGPYFNGIKFKQNRYREPNLQQYYITSRSLFFLSSCKERSVYQNHKRPRETTSLANLAGYRHFCSRKEQGLPKIMDFPQVIWPSVFKTARNWILSNFIIMRYFDNEFNLPDFVEGSKQAVQLVSGAISQGDIDSLRGLVTADVITQVRDNISDFTLKQRQEFAVKSDDIYFCFPYEVGVMFPNEEKNDGENQSRFVEITMCYHALLGLKELREGGANLPINLGTIPEYQEKLFICNYRFIREFTKGVQDDWTINAINHFKPADSLTGL